MLAEFVSAFEWVVTALSFGIVGIACVIALMRVSQ